jgi:uncharacterized protein (TIGR01777 family)
MEFMNITVTGATGLIGTHLVRKLLAAGHQVESLGSKQWNSETEPPSESLATADAIVHLAGEPVAQRWTPEAKKRIRNSRVDGTRHLVNALSTQARRPEVLISGSAIGFYGSRGDEIVAEDSDPGDDFLARVTKEWEQAAILAESLGIRVVRLRTGVVLAEKGGALAKMLPTFRYGFGGRLGSGKQWMSWIHIEDVVNLILFAIENRAIRGPLNLAAPHPVTNADFTKVLASNLHRPALFPVPAFAINAMFGEMAAMILGGQRVIPTVAQRAGYRFHHPDLREALADLLRPRS